MKRNTKFTIFTGMFSILLLVGCLMNDESPTKEKAIGITVGEAQQYFESSVKTFRLSPPKVTRSLDEESLATPLWGKASALEFENKEIVEVPVEAPATFIHEKRNLADTISKKSQWCNTAVSLVAEKGTDGNVFFTIARITVEGEYLKRHKERPIKVRIGSLSDFSGAVRYYTMQGELISGCKYSSGKIVGRISPCDSIKGIVNTSSSHEECTETVTEYTDYLCTDVYIGGELMSNTCVATGSWTQSEWHCRTVQDPDPVCSKCKQNPCVCSQSGGGNTGGGGTPPIVPVAPKAKAIFHNSNMTETDWKKLEEFLETIIDDCMGEGLYSNLLTSLNGNSIFFEFTSEKDAAYDPTTGILKLNLYMDSNELFHEMVHALQYYKREKNITSFFNARMNLDIEAHFAQYLYLKGSLEYDIAEWKDAVEEKHSRRHIAIMGLNKYLDDKGNIREGVFQDIVDTYVEFNVVEAFRRVKEYENYLYDSNRGYQTNFANLLEIAKNC